MGKTLYGYARLKLFRIIPAGDVCVCGSYPDALWWDAFHGMTRFAQILTLCGLVKIEVEILKD